MRSPTRLLNTVSDISICPLRRRGSGRRFRKPNARKVSFLHDFLNLIFSYFYPAFVYFVRTEKYNPWGARWTLSRMRFFRPVEITIKQIPWIASRSIAGLRNPPAMEFYENLGNYILDSLTEK